MKNKTNLDLALDCLLVVLLLLILALVAASRQLPATLENPVALARNSVAASARAAAVAAQYSMEPPAGLAVFMAAAVVEYLALALLALSSSRIMRLPGV